MYVKQIDRERERDSLCLCSVTHARFTHQAQAARAAQAAQAAQAQAFAVACIWLYLCIHPSPLASPALRDEHPQPGLRTRLYTWPKVVWFVLDMGLFCMVL